VPEAPPALRAPAPPPVPNAGDAPTADGVPAVVMVEVPIKDVPPPLAEEKMPSRPAQAEPPPLPKRPAPTMTLASRERGRRPSNRPRRPASVLAGLTLGGMFLLFVGLFGTSAMTWLLTEGMAHANRPQFANNQKPNFGPKGLNPGFVAPPAQNNPQVNPPIAPPQFDHADGTLEKFDLSPPGPKFDDKLATRLKLNQGTCEAVTQLSDNDPRDPVRRWQDDGGHPLLPCKVFLIELEKGKKYVIDYQRQVIDNRFDPYLRVESLDGERLVEHDDVDPIVGINNFHDMSSHIEFHPLRTATYRIVCTVYEQPLPPGQFTFALRVREQPVVPGLNPQAALPKPGVTNQTLKVSTTTEKDLQATLLDNDLGALAGDLCWSADGKAFFALYENGNLRRMARNGDSFVEQRRLNLGRKGGAMALAGQGLVVTLPSSQEVWLIDPDTLQVKQRFPAFMPSNASASRVAAAPLSRFAIVASTGQRPAGAKAPPGGGMGRQPNTYPPERGVVVLDLMGQQPARFYDLPNASLAMSPDGKYLFVVKGDVLASYSISADTGDLESKQTSLPYSHINADNRRRIEVSPDSKYVCVCGLSAPERLRKELKLFETAVFVYPVDDLKKPAFGINSNVRASAVGFDLRRGRILGPSNGASLAVYGADGSRRTTYVLAKLGLGAGLAPQQIAVSPDGGEQLIRFADNWICHTMSPADLVARVEVKLPAPTAVDDEPSVAAKPFKKGDVSYRTLELPNFAAIDPCWDAAGQALFHLESDGTLTRYSASDFVPRQRLALGKPAVAMALSKQGLLVALQDQAEVWVIDSQSLKVQNVIACPEKIKHLASHPNLALAAAVGAEVVLLDLHEGRLAARGLQAHPDAGLPFHSPTLTPDGKYLLLAHASAGSSKVLRVKVEAQAGRLTVEETKGTGVKGNHDFCVTADGKHVAWYSLNLKDRQTAFYPIADWKAPAFTLPQPARAMAMAADGALYVQTTELDLMRFADPADPEGVRLASPRQEGRVRDLAPRPAQPGAFLASISGQVYYAERRVK
jgi:hypothetical protein